MQMRIIPIKLSCMNDWSAVGGTVWKVLESVALLEICHWRQSLKCQMIQIILSVLLCLLL